MEFNFDAKAFAKEITANITAKFATAKPEEYHWTSEGVLIIVGDNSPMVVANMAMCQRFDTEDSGVKASFESAGIPVQEQAVMLSRQFWENTPEELREAVIAHEVGHITARHLFCENAAVMGGLMNVDSFEVEADNYAVKKCGAAVTERAIKHAVRLIVERMVLEAMKQKGGNKDSFGYKALAWLAKWIILKKPQMRTRFKSLKAHRKAGY